MDDRRARLRPRRLWRQRAHRRRGAGRAQRRHVRAARHRRDRRARSRRRVGRSDQWDDVVIPGTPMPDVDIDPDDDATILYTSGHDRPSEGRRVDPSGRGASAHGLRLPRDRRPAAESGRRHRAPTRSTFILVVPLFHVTGCVPVMLSCLSSGLKLVIMYKWDPERALELIERERVTNFVGVPTQSWDLLESPHFADHDTSSLRNVGGGGAPAPPELVRRVGVELRQGEPRHRLRHDRDQRVRPAERRRRLPPHPDQHGPGDADPARRGRATRTAARSRPAKRARSGSGDRTSSAATGTSRRRRRRRSSTAGSAAATSAASTTRDSSTSRTGRRTWSSAPARTSTAPRSRPRSTSIPACTRRRCSACPTTGSARRWRPRCCRVPAQRSRSSELQHHVRERLAPFKVPTRIAILDAPLPRNASGKILKRELRDDVTRSDAANPPSTAPGSPA